MSRNHRRPVQRRSPSIDFRNERKFLFDIKNLLHFDLNFFSQLTSGTRMSDSRRRHNASSLPRLLSPTQDRFRQILFVDLRRTISMFSFGIQADDLVVCFDSAQISRRSTSRVGHLSVHTVSLK